MSQETRKDPRTKIVSLNVRYKSATVDEFIEDHSWDVSRGGIFIKTTTPFTQGTLLKFEIRLSDDNAVIAGVGRVVWRREAPDAGAESPAGMGIKFIKIDDKSRATIELLLGQKGDAGGAFQQGLDATSDIARPTPPIGTVPANIKTASVPPRPKSTIVGNPPPGIQSGGTSGQRPATPIGKSTMLGIGAVSIPADAPTKSTSDAPAKPDASKSDAPKAGAEGEAPFFPATVEPAEPVKEPTMMKQADELLEEALKEAGGTVGDLQTNPLFSGRISELPPTARPKSEAPASVRPAPASVRPAAKESEPPLRAEPDVRAAARSVPPDESRSSETDPPLRKKKSSNTIFYVVIGLVAAAGATYMAVTPSTPTTPTTPSATATTPPSVTATATESAVPSATTSAATSASVPLVGSSSAKPPASAIPSAKPTVTATVAPTVTVAPKPTVTATATATVAPKPTVTATATASVAPKPPKPPKPPKDDDNPY